MSEASKPTLLHRLRHTPMRDLVRGRVSQRLDWRGVIDEAELSEPVSAMLKRLVRRTRLWRAEKVEVAHELVAHFEDALESGRFEEEALDAFGDWRRSAKLIRRATKRKRSYLWQAWRWSFWAFIGLLGCYVALGLYYLTGSPKLSVDYAAKLNAEALAVPEADRGWPILRDALIGLNADGQFDPRPKGIWSGVRLPDDSILKLIRQTPRVEPGHKDWPRVAAFLHKHQGEIAQVRKAAAMPGLGYVARRQPAMEDIALLRPGVTPDEHAKTLKEVEGKPTPLIHVFLPHLVMLRQSTALLQADARRAVAQGDFDTAYRNAAAIMQLAGHADEQRMLINQLVVISIYAEGYRLISEVITHHPQAWSDKQLVGLAHLGAKASRYRIDLTHERYWTYDIIQYIYTDNGSGNGYFSAKAARALEEEVGWFDNEVIDERDTLAHLGPMRKVVSTGIGPAQTLIAVDRKELTRKFDELFDTAQKQAELPLWESPEDGLDQALVTMMQSPYDRARYPMVAELMPSLGAAWRTNQRFIAHADGMLTGIALELYRRANGQYPASVQQLVPRYLPEPTLDRLTGKPLRLRIVDGKPIVYSVGNDLDDDSGRTIYDGDGMQDRGVMAMPDPKTDERTDGDWVVWPLHPQVQKRKPQG